VNITIDLTKEKFHLLIENSLFNERFLTLDEQRLILNGMHFDDNDVRYLLPLTESESISIRECLAAQPSTPEEILEVLAFDDDTNVKRALLTNEALSDELLEELADDDDEIIATLAQEQINS